MSTKGESIRLAADICEQSTDPMNTKGESVGLAGAYIFFYFFLSRHS